PHADGLRVAERPADDPPPAGAAAAYGFPMTHFRQGDGGPGGAPPLDGLTVLDFSRVLAGPYCTMQLADLGARVIKIEQPGRGDDTRAWGPPFAGTESAYFLSVNRNKESLALDLKHPRARRVLDPLIAKADIVVENFRPGTMERLGLGYDEVRARNPRAVYCSISGFGQTGPRRLEAGHHAMMQAGGGPIGVPGAPVRPPFRPGWASRSPTSRPGCSPCRASSRRSTRARSPGTHGRPAEASAWTLRCSTP